jgi:hypothetical protein
MVRNKILQVCCDEEHFEINKAFSSETFKNVIEWSNQQDEVL